MVFLRSGKLCKGREPAEQNPKFELFNKFPPEIRENIWSHALPENRYLHQIPSIHSHRLPILALTCKEAYSCTFKQYTDLSTINYNHNIQERYVDFSTDVFNIDIANPRTAHVLDEWAEDNTPAIESFRSEVAAKIRFIAISITDLQPKWYQARLCSTGFCDGLLPRLREIIVTVGNSSYNGAKRGSKKRKLEEEMWQKYEIFRDVEIGFNSWIDKCGKCGKSIQERCGIDKVPKLTFATTYWNGNQPLEIFPAQKR